MAHRRATVIPCAVRASTDSEAQKKSGACVLHFPASKQLEKNKHLQTLLSGWKSSPTWGVQASGSSPLDVLHDSHAPRVTPSGDHANVTNVELDRLDRLSSLQVHLDRVVHLRCRANERTG